MQPTHSWAQARVGQHKHYVMDVNTCKEFKSFIKQDEKS